MNTRLARRKARLEKILTKHKEELSNAHKEFAYLDDVPEAIPVDPFFFLPGSVDVHGPHKGAWLNMDRRSYVSGDVPPRQEGAEMLRLLEDAGWKPLPACLVKLDKFRPSVMVGKEEDIEDRYGRRKVTFVTPIKPLWVTAEVNNEHRTQQALAYYKSPKGLYARVSVPCKVLHVDVSRESTADGWLFRSARAVVPERAEALYENKVCVGTADAHAWVNASRSASARLTWGTGVTKVEDSLTPADILEQIMRGGEKQ